MGLLEKIKKLIRSGKSARAVSPSTNSEGLPPRKPMPLLDPVNPGKLPAKEINKLLISVNQLIEQYNKADNDTDKKAFLKQIQQKILDIDYKYPPSHLAASPGYQSMHAKLFKEIQYQYASLGTKSMRDDKQKPSSLPEIIANMSPEKASALLKILHKGANAKLGEELPNLYVKEDKSSEAENFRKFLRDNTVSFLGGGNSKNFKVQNNRTGKASVLKVDNRLNTPRNVEVHLRNQSNLKEKFTPNETERQVTAELESGKTVSRTLLVTEYCTGGSVLDHGKRFGKVSELVEKTGTIFEQMAGSMLDIQEAGCIFPDAKITNWLVDDNENVRIADTKSFLFTDNSGKYLPSIPGNEHCGFIHTPIYNPPEFYSSTIEADSTHAYILGKNLYYYAAGKFGQGADATKFDFNTQLFKTEKGSQFEALIKNLVKPDPQKRMSVTDAKDELFMINNPDFRDVLTELKALKFGSNDPQMNAYIRQKQHEVNSSKAPLDRSRILVEMKSMARALEADPATRELRQIISNYRENAKSFFSIGMNAKATRIERAMGQVPLEDRKNLLSSNKTQGVMEALASHRYFGKRGNVYKNEKGGVDPKKAATTFKKFREKFNIETKKLDSLKTPEANTGPRMK